MKELYLHVGTPKTGTSAIQRFLFDNQEVLKNKGFSFERQPYKYRGVGMNRNAHFLIGKFYDENGNIDKEKSREAWDLGLANVERQLENCEHVILSDESLWLNLAKSSIVLTDLQEWAEAREVKLRVIVYLRGQDDFAVSLWHQQVKEGTISCSFEDYKKKREVILRDSYCTNLNKIAAVIGRENVIVRKFDRLLFVGGSIQADFLNCLGGLELTDEYSMEHEYVNLSTNNNYTEILRLLNTLSDDAGVILNDVNRYYEQFALSLSEKDGEDSCLFDEKRRAEFLSRHKEGNEEVAREYFHSEDGVLFRAREQELPLWSADSDSYREAVIKFFGQVLLEQRAQLKECQRQEKAMQEKTAKLEKTMQEKTAKLEKTMQEKTAELEKELQEKTTGLEKKLQKEIRQQIKDNRFFTRVRRGIVRRLKKLFGRFLWRQKS